jgi:tetratricopeptide (TPR) repeat protein
LSFSTAFYNGIRVIRSFTRILCLLFFLLNYCSFIHAQHSKDDNRSRTDSLEIVAIGKQAETFFAYKDFEKADSLIEKQIMMAEESMNRNLVIYAYFNNVAFQSATIAKDPPDNTISYVRRALEYARSVDLPDYIAFALASISALNNEDGKLDEGFRNANQAYTTAINTTNDSAKIVCAIQLANTYLLRSDILMAFKVLTSAENIGMESQNKNLLPPVYHAMGNLYHRLQKDERAKQYIHQSLAINKEASNIVGQINDYIALAKYSEYLPGKTYIQTAVDLANSIANDRLKIEAEKLLFFHMLVQEKPSFMLHFLEMNQDLKHVFNNTGPSYLDWMYAEIFLYGGRADSALLHFKKAEPAFETGYDLSTRKGFIEEYASSLEATHNGTAAIAYYQKLFDMARASSDLRRLKNVSSALKKLYSQQGDYKQALTYSGHYDNYKDSVDLMGKERDFAKAEIDNLTRQQEHQEEIAREEERRKHNLQYLFITLCVGVVFLVLIMFGMFRVSTFAIRAMGFFSLIFFFEFMILILDKWIHHLTHGEPWKILLIKIGIVSILLPVHHYVEHKLIHYLLSKHLITLRSRLMLFSIFKKKKPVPPVEREEEQVENEIIN